MLDEETAVGKYGTEELPAGNEGASEDEVSAGAELVGGASVVCSSVDVVDFFDVCVAGRRSVFLLVSSGTGIGAADVSNGTLTEVTRGGITGDSFDCVFDLVDLDFVVGLVAGELVSVYVKVYVSVSGNSS